MGYRGGTARRVLALAPLVLAAACGTDEACDAGNPLMPVCVAERAALPVEMVLFQSDRDGNFEIYSMRTDGTELRRLTNNAGLDAMPRWSPDGAQIVFSAVRPGAARELYLMQADGSNVRRLTSLNRTASSPDWSPDGARIAFHATRGDGNFDLYVVRTDGSDLRRLTTSGGSYLHPRWSPDGSRLAFTWYEYEPTQPFPGGTGKIAVSAADGSGMRVLTHGGLIDAFPAWAPDGTGIVYNSSREIPGVFGGTGSVLTYVNADGTGERVLGPNVMGNVPAWSRTSGRIYFHSFARGVSGNRIYSVRPDGTDLRRVGLPVTANDQFPDAR
jgi:Tol biopolymer transport system component